MASLAPSRPKRRKRLPAEARQEGLAAARTLLLEEGPAAVTLARVGKEIGMSHANVIHHFGSAEGLQTALMESMIRDLADALDETVSHLRTDAAAPAMLIDRVFDAFDEGGAGQLAAWLALSGEQRRFEPIRRAVLDLVVAAREKFAHDATADHRIRLLVLLIAICAFGDAVIGPHLRDMLGEDDKAGRRLLTQLLPLVLVQLS